MRFKKGDKVKVYGHTIRLPFDAQILTEDPSRFMAYRRGELAKVISVYAEDEMCVRFEKGSECEVHPKQCRKVKL